MADHDELDDRLRQVRDLALSSSPGMLDRVLAAAGCIDEPVPHQIGRFLIEREVGRGGMGRVFAAFDPQLRRRVAVKRLRRDRGGSTGYQRSLMEVEAWALARLQVEHVVRIHEIGEHEGSFFVVMELIDGEDLGKWIKPGRRLPDILTCYLQAARGLSSAHATGLIHRDFKPTNALIDRDGKVFVADFGLAMDPAAVELDQAAESTTGGSSTSADREPAGTKTHMAPEQLVFGSSGASADQFSFCVSMWEAISGSRPYDERQLRALATGEASPRPCGRARVPGWIARILMRGLRARPEERWESMDALISALTEAPQQRKRTLTLGLSGFALFVGGTAAYQLNARVSCDPSAELAGVWDQDVAVGFRARELPEAFAAAALADVSERLDAYATRWSSVYSDACVARRHDGTRTTEQWETAVQCLYRSRADLAATVSLLQTADAELLARAPAVAEQLALPDACLDPVRVEELSPRDLELDRAAAEARLYVAAGEPWRSSEIIDRIGLSNADHSLPATDAWLAYGGAQYELANYSVAEHALLSGLSIALSLGDYDRAAECGGDLVGVYADAVSDPERANAIGVVLSTMQHRTSERAALELRRADGRLAQLGGDFVVAKLAQQDVLSRLERADDRQELEVTRQQKLLGTVFQDAQELAAAREIYGSALAKTIAVLGPDHPEVAVLETALGSVALEALSYDEATAHFQAAITIVERAFGDRSLRLAGPLTGVAYVDLLQSRLEHAAAFATRAWDLQKDLQPGHVERGNALAVLAATHLEMGAYEVAIPEHVQLLIEIRSRGWDKQIAQTEQNLGYALCQVGRCSEARKHFENVLAQGSIPDYLRTWADGGLAQVELSEGRVAAAEAMITRLLSRPDVDEASEPRLIAELYLNLARARQMRGARREAADAARKALPLFADRQRREVTAELLRIISG